MLKKVKSILIGRPLESSQAESEKYGILWGLPILSSDAISSVAYAIQEISFVLIPVVGLIAYKYMIGISSSIILLLLILVLSYRQIISEYPAGGGAYVVAKENIGIHAGATAGAALCIDYIMTVAVSISSGVDQLISAVPLLLNYKVLICVIIVVIIMLGNMRGVRESSKMFGVPAYLFVFFLFLMIVMGITKYFMGTATVIEATNTAYYGAGAITIMLILRAFSNGCTALSGVEAISNAVPNFKSPSTKNAKGVLSFIALIITVLFGGTTLLAVLYQVKPGEGMATVMVQLASAIIGTNNIFSSILFYFTVGTFVVILMLAANTAFTGFPMLVSVMANDSYFPRQFKMRGDRLSYSNGILTLSIISIFLIIIFKAEVTHLIGLYAIGVFISFTLSQFGILLKIVKEKKRNWRFKAFINGFGCIITGVTIFVVAITKFTQGAWIVVLLIPILVFLMIRINRHYKSVAEQLKIDPNKVDGRLDYKYDNRVIVLVESINLASIRGIRYARTISDDVRAFCVVVDESHKEKIKNDYDKLNSDVPLFISYSPYRKIVGPLLQFIDSEEYDYKKGDIITVVMPHFNVKSKAGKLLHNHTQLFIEKELLKHKHIVVADIPLQLKK